MRIPSLVGEDPLQNRLVGGIGDHALVQLLLAFVRFRGQDVTAEGMAANDLTRARLLEPLGRTFVCLQLRHNYSLDVEQERPPNYSMGREGVWNSEIPATPAAPAARHAGAFASVTPPSASTGIRTARAASANAGSPRAGPYAALEFGSNTGLKTAKSAPSDSARRNSSTACA